jgi:hypothetical protein
MFLGVWILHKLVHFPDLAMAISFAAAALIAAPLIRTGAVFAAAFAALRAVRARDANLFTLAAVVILSLFFGHASDMADGHQPFVAAALRTAAALIAARCGAARRLGIASRFGGR